MKSIAAYVSGPILWLIVYGVIIILAVGVWGFNPESYFVIAFITYLGSSFGSIAAHFLMKRIKSSISDKAIYIYLAVFTFVWLGAAVSTSQNELDTNYRIIALIMAQVGIYTSWRMDIAKVKS